MKVVVDSYFARMQTHLNAQMFKQIGPLPLEDFVPHYTTSMLGYQAYESCLKES